jgi:hypothetical protein
MSSEPDLVRLFSSACPSIQYRVGSDLLHRSIDSYEMRMLQTEILADSEVQKQFNSQTPDGWFGLRFHGYDSFESGIRILVEKGVSLQHPVLVRAMDALDKDSERILQDLGSFGRYFDKLKLGGTKMIQAWLLALGGRYDHPLVAEQVMVALEGMQSVLMVNNFSEATEIWRNHLVFKPGIQWPGIYHLRLLAYTQDWRNTKNLTMIANVLKNLVQFSPIPQTHVRKGSQLIAPASFAMLDFNSDLRTLDAPGWMQWFHRMEMLARMGVLQNVNIFDQQIGFLKEILKENDGKFNLPLSHDYFKHWGAYTGLMLEPDWKKPIRRINDLTFRSHLIINGIYPFKQSEILLAPRATTK